MRVTNHKPLKIGTRNSKLARAQTDFVIQRLIDTSPGFRCEIVAITTTGDKETNRPIAEIGVPGSFVKELEDALLSNKVDLVVHSLKDMPVSLPVGLVLASVPDRADPRDVLVSHKSIYELPPESRIATSSRRRIAQLKSVRSDLSFLDIRGNLTTRLQKYEQGECDALVLAAAGLLRLGLADSICQYLSPEISTPAAGQGALAVECRLADTSTLQLLKSIDNLQVRAEITAERSFLARLGGGCSVPIGALCITSSNQQIVLTGCIAALDGSTILQSNDQSSSEEAEALGIRLAESLLTRGAQDILRECPVSAPNTVSAP